jgi:hypothetical protein
VAGEQAAGGRMVGARGGPVDHPCALTLGLGVAGVRHRRGEVGDGTVAGGRRVVRRAEHVVAIHTQIGSILGDRTSGSLQAALTAACADPPGISHLERPGWPTS